ncbi:MmgE/PrpD family protein [Spirillospora sp. NPDC029432]|uniref:MmgE/PrpD family protein n=1 Tax=Spirillospora sp. NPDC029432 TaxID=3154599 RepID=UPI003455F6BF
MTVLEELAARSARAPLEAGAGTRALAALHVLDTAGCVIAGSSHPLAAALPALAATGGSGALAVIGLPGGHPLRTAVLVESALAHVDEYDALHPAAAVVPAAVTVPAALAVADREDLSGRAVADAVIAGYEAAAEAGIRFGGPRLYERSWWPTALFGALGAAAATASLLALDEDRTAAALGIAAAGLGGLLSADALGTGHYLLAGRAAADGVEAAYLARGGADASRTLLDGPAAAALGAAPGPATAGGHLRGCSFKAYPCARPLHAALDALTALVRRGVPVAAARRIEIGLPGPLLRFVTADRNPPGPAEAAASAAFAVGALLSDAAGDASFYRGALPPGVPEVVLLPDPGLDRNLPGRWGARVTVRPADGGPAHEEVCEEARPAGEEAVVAKFRRQAGGAEDRISRCLALDEEPRARGLRRDLFGRPSGDTEC